MATLRQLAASLPESEKGLFTESPYPNRYQELAGITLEMKQLAVDHQLLLVVSSLNSGDHSLFWDSLLLSIICNFVELSIAFKAISFTVDSAVAVFWESSFRLACQVNSSFPYGSVKEYKHRSANPDSLSLN